MTDEKILANLNSLLQKSSDDELFLIFFKNLRPCLRDKEIRQIRQATAEKHSVRETYVQNIYSSFEFRNPKYSRRFCETLREETSKLLKSKIKKLHEEIMIFGQIIEKIEKTIIQ